jgi:hypothetical protein
MTIKSIKKALLSKGFKYLKVELEALVSPSDEYQERECCECDGMGDYECSECQGTGAQARQCPECLHAEIKGTLEKHNCSNSDCEGGFISVECAICDGSGRQCCNVCNGDGYLTDDEYYFEEFEWNMFNLLPAQVKEKIEYHKFYNDGSVDTEMTFTISINSIEYLPEIIRCFENTCFDFGDCDTNNAGMHITLLRSVRYPSTHQLDKDKITNFKQEVSKLLLALSVFACPDDRTRGFNYRELQVSSKEKYSAIYTHGDTCIEYRIFDTCYDKPEYIVKNLETIIKTLRYYSNKKIYDLKERSVKDKNDTIISKKHYEGRKEDLKRIFDKRGGIERLIKELPYFTKNYLRMPKIKSLVAFV